MSTTPDGASLSAHFAEPAIDLATLVEGLAEAVPTPPDAGWVTKSRNPHRPTPLIAAVGAVGASTLIVETETPGVTGHPAADGARRKRRS